MISGETRKRVWDAIGELGYVPDARAQALRSGDTHTLGLIMPDIHNPHFCETAEGVEQEARASGYNLLLSSAAITVEHINTVFSPLLDGKVDGLIVMGTFTSVSEETGAYLNRFFKRHSSIVEICGNHTHNHAHYDLDRVCSDYYAAAKEAMAYLMGMNHRRIGMIYGVEVPEPGLDRLRAYEECLLSAGLPIDEGLVIRCGSTLEAGYQAASELLSLPERPTAIIAINDVLAIAALRAIRDVGLRLPDDISLLGFDDIPVAQYLVPRVTTVSKDIIALGRRAVQLLLTRIENPQHPRQTETRPARLIIRESTGPAPY